MRTVKNPQLPSEREPRALPARATSGPPWALGRAGASAESEAAGAADLRRYAEVLRRRWRLLLAVVAAVVLAVGVGTLLQTPVYRASGLLELRGQSSEGVPIEELFQASRLSSQFLGTQYGMLRSPALTRRVMADVGLLAPAPARAASGPAAPADAHPDVRRQIDAFSKNLLVDPVSGSSLVWVHFESPDPTQAARVVNAVFTNYASMRVEAARAAVARLRGETDRARQRLTDGERALQSFARRHGMTYVGGVRGAPEAQPDERLRVLRQELAAAEADRYTKESLNDMTRRRGDALLESEVLEELRVRHAALRSEYAKLSATFLPDYPRAKELREQVREVEALIARERARLRSAAAGGLLAARRREGLLQQALADERSRVDQQGEHATQYRILARDVEAQQDLYARLQERVRAAEVTAAVAAADVAVVEAATVPADPVRPVLGTNLLLALLAGLALGLGAVYLRDYTDVTVRSADELGALSVPLLGLIPSAAPLSPPPIPRRVAAWADVSRSVGAWAEWVGGRRALAPGAAPLVRIDLPERRGELGEALADAFGTLRTAVMLVNGDRHAPRTLLITSARPGDGKTTVAVNLALSLARLGGRVLLVDADTRRPSSHRSFGVAHDRGLGDYLRGEAPWESLVHSEVAPGLDLLPAGLPFGTTTEALASAAPSTLLAEARQLYDFVLLDSPALHISAPDTRLLSPLVDGTVLVVRSGATPRALLDSMLQQVPNVVGVVLNDVSPREVPTYYYYANAEPSGREAAT